MNAINTTSAALATECDEISVRESDIADAAIEAWFRHATALNGFGAGEAVVDREVHSADNGTNM